MSFLRWLGRRPLWLLHALGAMLGWLAWWGSRRYRQRMRDNAALAGQGADTVRAAVPEAGRMIELDGIVGAVVEIARRLEIETPSIDALFGLTRLFGRMHGLYPG